MKSFATCALLTAVLATATMATGQDAPAAGVLIPQAPAEPRKEGLAEPDRNAVAEPLPDQSAEAEVGPMSDATGPILEADETTLEDWLWIRRPLVVFADSPADPRYVQQMQYITERLDDLVARDVVVITDTDPSAQSSVRSKLRARGFMLVILAKDGTIVARKPAPWSVREITRSIDKLPLRQQEVRDRRTATN